jgi:primosomal protein N' (replication factor Y) (superfamily II helicase)
VDSSPIATERIVGVAVPVPGLGLLSYRVPAGMPIPPKGARVTVPLGSRSVTGCVVLGVESDLDVSSLKDLVAALDSEPFLPSDIVDLALWVAEYYACGPGDVLTMAMPPQARRGEATSFKTAAFVRLSDAGRAAAPRGERQQALLAALAETSEPVAMSALSTRDITPDVVRRAARAGHVTITEEVEERDPFADEGGSAAWTAPQGTPGARALTDEQAAALTTLVEAADARAFRAVLLHGVTGSGKTEVYLRLARHVMEAGRRVLVLVPEIALTPALAGLLRSTFGSRVGWRASRSMASDQAR